MTPPWMDDVAWQQNVVVGGLAFHWGRLGTDYVAEWVGRVVVRTDAEGRVKNVLPDPRELPELVEKTINGEMGAFARSICGRLSLHASAVVLDGRAVILVGASGAGKSTLASCLCEHFGAELLADDVAGLGGSIDDIRVEPSERAVWLEDGSGAKLPRRVRVALEPAALAAIVALRFEDGCDRPDLIRVSGGNSVRSILDALLRFDVAPETRAREFDHVIALADAVPMWQLVRSRVAPSHKAARLIASRVLANGVGCGGNGK